MGDERRSEKLKQDATVEEPVKAKRTSDAAEPDTAHAERQLELRTAGRGSRGQAERAGFNSEETVDHQFEGVGDQHDASAEIKRILDAGVAVAGFVVKVQNLDALRREEVAKRIADVAKVATGNEVLQIGDLVGVAVAEKLRAALASGTAPTPGALRAHALELSIEERIALLDQPTRKLLEAKFAAPAEIIPGITELGAEVRKHPELVAWFLRTTPARAAALSILRSSLSRPLEDDEALAKVFNDLGAEGWKWALTLDAATAQRSHGGAPRQWAQLTNQAAVREHLESIAPIAVAQPGSRPGGARALQALVPDGNVDVAAVIAALQDARTYSTYIKDASALAKSPYRERLIAAASLEQLELILSILVYEGEDLGWMIESPHASPETLRPILAGWSGSSVAGVADQPKLLAKMMSRFPAAGPTDFFGHQARELYPAALRNPIVRKWCTINADPRDLLMLVAQQTDSIARMWKGVVADGVPADWYKGLGTGVGASNDERLRKLALNTPDHEASAWIRHTLIGDLVEDKVSGGPTKIPDIAFEGDAGKRFQQGLASDATADLGQRAAELSDQDVANLRANPAQLATLLPKLQGEWLLHDLLRIQAPLPLVLLHADPWNPGLASYIRTRPASETTEAFASDEVEQRLTRYVRTPFETLPALREPAVLASVLRRASTLTWLLQKADVPYVMSLLAHPGPGKAAAKLFSTEHVQLVPDLLHRAEDRAAVTRFASYLHGALADRMVSKAEDPAEFEEEEEEEEDSTKPRRAERGSFKQGDVDARQAELEAALATGDLAKGLELVLQAPVQLQNVLAVCRERGQAAAKLVGKPEHEATVKKLRAAVEVSPLAVFPSVPYYAYFHTATSREWLFKHEDAMTILREVSNDPQLLRLVVDKLDTSGGAPGKDTSIDTWLDRMPKGTALSAGDRKLVKRMFDEANTAVAARKLFEIRFGTRMTPTFTHAELTKLWAMLERVPDAHIEMGAVQGFTESKTLGGYSGLYSGGDHRIDLEDNLINANKPAQMFDQQNELTREQLVAAYGYDDVQIQARIAHGQLEERKTAKGTRYVIKPVATKLLDSTVLHEIGHAVDDMLGERTELVYGLAGWREFGESDIDELARDLGNWDKVKPDDQERIKDAWAVWLNSRTDDGLDKFVPENHPALAEKYKGVGIVELARKKQSPDIHMGLFKGKFTITNHKYQRVYRVPDKTRNASPTSYSLTAPQEWFAECYAEYYREYQGPGTEDKKGGHLAGWIKGWFDQNIDTLKYNPERVDRPKGG